MPPISKQVGRYTLTEVCRTKEYLILEGYESEQRDRHVRVKAYFKDKVDRESISYRLGVEEKILGRTVAYLRSRYHLLQNVASASSLAAAAAGEAEDHPHPCSAAGQAAAVRDADVALLYRCSAYVALVRDKMQSPSKVFLIRDSFPASLQTILLHGRLPEEGAFYYFFQLLMAVHFLHQQHVYHRDISTEHIYLARSGTQICLGGLSSCVLDGQQPREGITNACRTTPQPGSYGICTNCHRDVSIVAEAAAATSAAGAAAISMAAECNSSSSSCPTTSSSSGGEAATAPPINTLFTTCKHCGIYQSRLQVLQSAIGTPGYLAPEILAYHPPASSLMTSVLTNNCHSSFAASVSSDSGGELSTTPTSDAALPRLGSIVPATRLADGQAQDMWACGVVLYYMLTASLPFDPLANGGTTMPPTSTRTPQQVYDMCCRIVAVDYSVPDYLSSDARTLLLRLLQSDPQRRPTALELMDHASLSNARKALLGSP